MKTEEIWVFEARKRLSELLEKVRLGQVFVITRRGHPIAELRPLTGQRWRFTFGCLKGQIWMSPDFDAPLPDMQLYVE